MKKIFIVLGIVIALTISVIIIFITKKSTDYIKITYDASYMTYKVLNNKKSYEIVNSFERLNTILNTTGTVDEINIYNDAFFKDKNLLVVEGDIDSEIKTLKVGNNRVKIKIYISAPLTTSDTIHKFDLYIIPIGKNIDYSDITVDISAYPGRVY